MDKTAEQAAELAAILQSLKEIKDELVRANKELRQVVKEVKAQKKVKK